MVSSVKTRRLDALTRALAEMIDGGGDGVGYKHDVTGTPATGVYSHGPGGVLTWPGVDPAVFHTAVGNIGILSQIPAVPSVFMTPTFMVLTGVRADTGSEKSAVCDIAPVAGLMKAGMITSQFGRYERSTPELEINRLGQRNDRADPLDLTLVGSPIGVGGPFAGLADPTAPGDVLTNEVSRKFWELNMSFHRLLSQQLWTGDPANNSAAGGYKELTGFNQLVSTGYVDAETNLALPSVDSDIQSFANFRVDQGTNGNILVDKLSYIYRTRKDLASRTGVMPVRWVFVMRPELFYEVTKVWPCSYLSYMCNLGGNAQLQINAADQVRMRDDLREGRYLIIDGDRIEVVLDDGIPFDDGNDVGTGTMPRGCKRSHIYLLPMSVVGGRSVLFMEYFDYGNPSITSALGVLDGGVRREGAFLISVSRTIWCVKWQAKIEPRLVLRTPWLAGQLQNIVYCPTEDTRQPFPNDTYFVDGGKTQRVGPSYYKPW